MNLLAYSKLPIVGPELLHFLGGEPATVWAALNEYLEEHSVAGAAGSPNTPTLQPSPSPLRQPDLQFLKTGDILLLADCRVLRVAPKANSQQLAQRLELVVLGGPGGIGACVHSERLRDLSLKHSTFDDGVLLQLGLRVLAGPNNWPADPNIPALETLLL